MTRADIINELENRGYKAEEYNTIKNDIEMEGIRIHAEESDLIPVIYTKKFIEEYNAGLTNINDIVDTIIKTLERLKEIKIDTGVFKNKDRMLDNIYIGFQKESNQSDIIKKKSEFDGIEEYLYIRENLKDGEIYTSKISQKLIDYANISIEEAWKKAEINTIAETKLESMHKIFEDILGIEYTEDIDENNPMFVISNEIKNKGAACILNKKILVDFANRFNVKKIVLLPSSIHEMIVLPYFDGMDENELNEMVRQVNVTEVNPTERLTDRAYILEIWGSEE